MPALKKTPDGLAPLANGLMFEIMAFTYITAQRHLGVTQAEAIANFQDRCNPDPENYNDRNVKAAYDRLFPLYIETKNYYKAG